MAFGESIKTSTHCSVKIPLVKKSDKGQWIKQRKSEQWVMNGVFKVGGQAACLIPSQECTWGCVKKEGTDGRGGGGGVRGELPID